MKMRRVIHGNRIGGCLIVDDPLVIDSVRGNGVKVRDVRRYVASVERLETGDYIAQIDIPKSVLDETDIIEVQTEEECGISNRIYPCDQYIMLHEKLASLGRPDELRRDTRQIPLTIRVDFNLQTLSSGTLEIEFHRLSDQFQGLVSSRCDKGQCR